MLVTNPSLCFAVLVLCHAGYEATRIALATDLGLCFAVLDLWYAGYGSDEKHACQ